MDGRMMAGESMALSSFAICSRINTAKAEWKDRGEVGANLGCGSDAGWRLEVTFCSSEAALGQSTAPFSQYKEDRS
jgi:hypothetical protein